MRGPVALASDLPPERSVPFLIRDVNRRIQRHLEARLISHEIAVGWWFCLRALWEQDGPNQRELSRRAGILDGTTVTVIDRLEQEGLVKRIRNSSDRRLINIYLTPRGRKLKQRSHHVSAVVDAKLLDGFSAFEKERLKNYFFRLKKNLDAAGSANGPGLDSSASAAGTELVPAPRNPQSHRARHRSRS
jgi:DNA-binding MarR family transcriptional regulator